MRFSVKKTMFCILLPTGIYSMIQYVNWIGICSLKQSQLPLQISLKLKKIIERYRVPKEKVHYNGSNGNLYIDPYQILSSIFPKSVAEKD